MTQPKNDSQTEIELEPIDPATEQWLAETAKDYRRAVSGPSIAFGPRTDVVKPDVILPLRDTKDRGPERQ